MKSMTEIMAEVNAQVAASRFTRIACGAGLDGEIGAAARRETRSVIPGICRDAKRLGVSRMHLWAVLNGHRESEGLVRRYEALKQKENAPA